MILVIDNYDSFTHNLARLLRLAGRRTRVVRNDAIDAAAARDLRPEAVVLSPGPGGPEEAGCSIDIARELSGEVPLLGVCLGMQAIAAAFGGRVVRAEPMHGRTSEVQHDGTGLFGGLPSPLEACRYHSLAVEPGSLPDRLRVTAWSGDAPMALAHRDVPTFGVQFHPEAILTQHGGALVANFLRLAGTDGVEDLEPPGDVGVRRLP